MFSPTNLVLNQATRTNYEDINVLSFVSHERFEPNLCKVGCTFWSIHKEGCTRAWNTKYAPIPKNYNIVKWGEVPPWPNIDLIITHNVGAHMDLIQQIRAGSNTPIISVWHIMPAFEWDKETYLSRKPWFDLCKHHVFISEFNRQAWQFDEENSSIILHGMDTDLFTLGEEKEPFVLTVANDFINRDWALGFTLWQNIVSSGDLPVKLIGDTPTISTSADSIEEIVHAHQKSLIYLNTSLYSPIPMSVLEAMACGSCVVSTSTCLIPDIIESEVDGFIFSPREPEKFVQCIKHLLANPNEAIEIGLRAREKVKKMFGIDRFVREWRELITNVLG